MLKTAKPKKSKPGLGRLIDNLLCPDLFSTPDLEATPDPIPLYQIAWQVAQILGFNLEIVQLILQGKTLHVLNLGMGVESSAMLVRLLLDPNSRPLGLSDLRSQLIVQTAQTGNEMSETQWLMEEFLYPLLSLWGIRTIQAAKAGASRKDGYVILEDTRRPDRCYIEGVCKLFDNQNIDGTSIRVSRPHTCALRWKGEVLDDLQMDLFLRFLHWLTLLKAIAFRFTWRLFYWQLKLEEYFAPHLGYSVEEQSRIKKVDEYVMRGSRARFLLDEWGWTRADCLEYLYWVFGVLWRKSACGACVFMDKKTARGRYERDPAVGGYAAFTELIALCFNPKIHLFGWGSCWEFLLDENNNAALAFYEAELDRCIERYGWGLYRCDRYYYCTQSNRKDSKRRVTLLQPNLTFAEALRELHRIGQYRHLKPECDGRIWRMYEYVKQEKVLPTYEGFWVIAPAIVRSKVQYPDSFSRRWQELTGNPDPYRWHPNRDLNGEKAGAIATITDTIAPLASFSPLNGTLAEIGIDRA